MNVKIEDNDDNLQEIMNRLEELANKQIEIGIFGEDDSELLMIAIVNEYGIEINVTDKMRGYLWSQGMNISPNTDTITIPERSFVRSAYDDKQKEIEKQSQVLIEKYISLEIDSKAFWDTLGEALVSRVQEQLTEVKKPPNHPYTIKRKDSSNPLVDSGRLKQAITWKVR